MFHDPDFQPFEPRAEPSLRAYVRNYLENFPPEAYREGVAGFKRLNRPETLFLTDPDLIEEVLTTRAEFFPRDRITPQALSNVVDPQGLFLAKGAHWRWQRRAAAPAFRHENLLALTPIFFDCAERQAQSWRRAGTARIDVAQAMMGVAFDVILRAVIGDAEAVDRDRFLAAETDAFSGFSWQFLLAALGLPKFVPHPGFLKMHLATRYLRRETARLIAARGGADKGGDILSLLIKARDPETGRAMNDRELLANLFTFISAGHETAATALAWTLWLVAKDQATQERLRAEIREVAGDGPIGRDEIEGLVFTRRVLQESMRLFSPVGAISRQPRDATILGGRPVEKGAQVVIAIWALHRNEKLWPDPLGFDPERFAPDAAKARHRYAYLPFGGGPRICIGMSFAMLEMTTVLATLVRACVFKTVEGFKPDLQPNISNRPRRGLPLIVSPA
ncbi:cytochrome P450 [Methylocystis parvus]|uniref:Cytochrome P450 n=1 Tax=Methylocystis parvus TaxID=134 RepID=A0A6B8M400_9HYPH|nr:cytochrome P450 [Methylocystis parvus]QGM97126.1 cytochrome P450 [Methylocystis parvus]WBJ98971.1 cytochrome P450 [Methylocystis parvus OBBP]